MRITGGNAARRILKIPKGLDVRPTPDLVKQAVFNSLGARVVGARVLELFAGTRRVEPRMFEPRRGIGDVHREIAPSTRNSSAATRHAAGFGEILEVRTQDVFPVLSQLAESGRQFDLILADPPYGEKNMAAARLHLRSNSSTITNLPKLLAPGGRFVLGHTKRDTLEIVAPWTEVKMLKHGDSRDAVFGNWSVGRTLRRL